MNCLYCGTELSPLRSLQYGEYCSDEHYVESACEHIAADYLILLDPPEPVSPPELLRSLPAFSKAAVLLEFPSIKCPSTWDPKMPFGSLSGLTLCPRASESEIPEKGACQRPFVLAPIMAPAEALRPLFAGLDEPLPAGFCGGFAPGIIKLEAGAPKFDHEPTTRGDDRLRYVCSETHPTASFAGSIASPQLKLAEPFGFGNSPKPCAPAAAGALAASTHLSESLIAPRFPSLQKPGGRTPELPWGSMADLSIFPSPAQPREPVVIPATLSTARRLELPKVRLFPSTPALGSVRLGRDKEPDLRQLFSSTPRRDWGSMFRRWLEIPRYLKVLASLVPVILAAMLASAGSTGGTMSRVSQGSLFSKPFSSIQATLRQRAAVIASDDFRAGMDKWRTRGDLTAPWVIDSNQFVHPAAFATFAPSEDLSDYNLEFQVQIDRHALGVAFRVQGWNDYYAVKVPQPATSTSPPGDIIWYKVVAGRETGRVSHPFPKGIPRNSLQTVRLEVAGGDFTLITQGKVVDYWSDGRFRKGGIGFFCTKGDRARVRWVEVRHQDDFVGQLCALLAPPDAQIRNRNGK